jgi:hypothetical protein
MERHGKESLDALRDEHLSALGADREIETNLSC